MAVAADALSSHGRVLDRYRPLRPLGSGGSGSVWLAHDEVGNREVALKIVAREGRAGPRAEREAAAAARLRHERCQRAFELASDDGHVYIAYEYVPGRTLREAMRRGELHEPAAVEAAAQILDGLAHAHAQGIVHRDVKPANVLLADGPGVSVRILDFGLAQLADADALTATGDVPGTLAYIAPERLKGDSGSAASDVWSVGVMLWEALAGRHPFAGGSLVETATRIASGAPSLATARPDLPRRIIAAVDRALARDPGRRPTAIGLARALRQPRQRAQPRDMAAPWRIDVTRLAGAVPFRPVAARLAPSFLVAIITGFGASVLPFYPTGWPALLAACAAALALVTPRAALAFALTVPFFPLGNVSAGLAIVYGLVAAAWLGLFFRDPRSGPAFAVGPLLGAVLAIGLVPIVLLRVGSMARRFALGTTAVVASALVSAFHGGSLPLTGEASPDRLALHATRDPLTAVSALLHAAAQHPAFACKALAVGAVAAALPFLRRRALWASVLAGGALTLAALLPTPRVAGLPLAVAGLLTGLALEAERRDLLAGP